MKSQTLRNTIYVLRAVGVEFARRIYLPIVIVFVVIAIIACSIAIWLTTMSAWWWIFAVLVFVAVLIAGIILGVVAVVLHILNPHQTTTQKSGVKTFVDKLQGLSEITQTPKFILLFRITRDVVSPREDGFVKTTIGHTLSLRKDFESLKNSFDS